MPRNSIHQLTERAGPSGPSPLAMPTGLPPEISLPPELATLLAQRRELEARMSGLTGGPAPAQAFDPRYPVTPLGERRQADDVWARSHDERSPSPNLDTDLAGAIRGADEHLHLAERTGQRALTAPALRTGQRALRDRIPGSAIEPTPALQLDPATNDPRLRDFGRDLPELPTTEVRSLKERFSHVRDRLDLLAGGSGDLDHLRELAGKRLAARRLDAARDERRDQARLDREQMR